MGRWPSHGILAFAAMTAVGAPCQAAGYSDLKFSPGWDLYNIPLDYQSSDILYSVVNSDLLVRYRLVGAQPGHLYQLSVNIQCQGPFFSTFGDFSTVAVVVGQTGCESISAQGVTQAVEWAEVASVLTDRKGDAAGGVTIHHIASGDYKVFFAFRNGGGCWVVGGGGGTDVCDVDYQAPGPFGASVSLTIPAQ